MDNLPRHPRGWQPDGNGILLEPEHVHETLRPLLDRLGSTARFQWNEQGRWIDMSAQMAFDARLLAELAGLLGKDSDAGVFSAEHQRLGELIHERCWNESAQIYFDLAGAEQIERFHVGAYWTLIAGIVPEDCVAGLVSHLSDPDKFFSLVPVATLARDDPDFEPTGRYWRGSSWPPTTYMVLAGLRHVGEQELATRIAERYLEAVLQVFEDTGTLWENLAPDARQPGKPAQPDFCGWAGLGSVAIPHEFLGMHMR
jgi:neutral trehalase